MRTLCSSDLSFELPPVYVRTYTPVIGLEIHAQLRTKSKMFAPEATSYGALPNTVTSEVSLGYPGTLPTVNRKAIVYAIRMGLACKAKITHYNHFDRKNYFYPDLPKGYQITQYYTPICRDGRLSLPTAEGEKLVRIERIHLEEDTGKSLHNLIPGVSLLDFNRAGTPLIEIVTAPDMNSAEEAFLFLTKIRQLVRYLNICDGNMEQGSLRCDVNISLQPDDKEELCGARVEVKNLNSISNVKSAITYETKRQLALLQSGKTIRKDTRSYSELTKSTLHMRDKATLQEYRYFPEPDITPFRVSKEWVEEIRSKMPLLPEERYALYTQAYKLSDYDATTLIQEQRLALFFEKIIAQTKHYKVVANWLLGPIQSYRNQTKASIEELPITIEQMLELTNLVAVDKLPFSSVAAQVFPLLLRSDGRQVRKIAEALGLLKQVSDEQVITAVKSLLTQHPEKVASYKSGKKGLMGFFIGEILRTESKGWNPIQLRKILSIYLDS